MFLSCLYPVCPQQTILGWISVVLTYKVIFHSSRLLHIFPLDYLLIANCLICASVLLSSKVFIVHLVILASSKIVLPQFECLQKAGLSCNRWMQALCVHPCFDTFCLIMLIQKTYYWQNLLYLWSIRDLISCMQWVKRVNTNSITSDSLAYPGILT